ncbi:Phage integrase family protein [Lachnospiraceae bacterium XBB1006]|nr:Phage integrase family protein [Lachnospiraceae bacterium XBB1006]
MSVKRRDNKNRILRTGESQEADGRYKFRYIDANGKRKSVYSWRLVATDSIPAGKRDNAPLREQEKTINRDIDDSIVPDGGGMTVSVLINDTATREAITRKQERTFLDFIKNDSHYCRYYDGMYILFKTGRRISEFTGLTVHDLDMENRTINIDHQLQKTGTLVYIDTTKTYAGTRVIPMLDDAKEEMEKLALKAADAEISRETVKYRNAGNARKKGKNRDKSRENRDKLGVKIDDKSVIHLPRNGTNL